MLEALRAAGIKVGVLSNTIWPRAWHEGFFERDGVLDLIDGDVYTSEIPWTKPSPHAFRAAMDAVGVTDPARCVYVGDRLFDDVWGAHNAGMRAIHVPHSVIPADQVGHTEGEPDAVVHASPRSRTSSGAGHAGARSRPAQVCAMHRPEVPEASAADRSGAGCPGCRTTVAAQDERTPLSCESPTCSAGCGRQPRRERPHPQRARRARPGPRRRPGADLRPRAGDEGPAGAARGGLADRDHREISPEQQRAIEARTDRILAGRKGNQRADRGHRAGLRPRHARRRRRR